MDAERFAAILEAYGSEPRRWPAAERASAGAFAGTAVGRRLLHAAAALDEVLDGHAVPHPDPDLRARVLDIRPRGRRRMLGLPSWELPWAPGALAAAGLAGLVFGAALSQGSTDGEADALLAEAESFDVAVLAADLAGEQL